MGTKLSMFVLVLLSLFSAPAIAQQQETGIGGNYIHGQIFNDCGGSNLCPSMVAVKSGTFVMGSNKNEKGRLADEGPQRQVRIRGLAVGRFEVTVRQYLACVQSGKCRNPEWLERGSDFNINTGDDDHYDQLSPSLSASRSPIVGISWHDAKDYVRWLGERTGLPYRLLTEAEWEYVAKSGTTTPYWWGNKISQNHANYKGSFKLETVNAFKPNFFGLYNVIGNVGEWVEDCWHNSYFGAPGDGRAWLTDQDGDCTRSVIRGGSWYYSPRDPRVHLRRQGIRKSRFNNVGFRVARPLQ